VILSPHEGEGWAVGCFPGQFLRRTELIKMSLRLDDEPTWWCQKQLQMRCFTRERSEAQGQQALKPSMCLSRLVLPARPPARAVLPPLQDT